MPYIPQYPLLNSIQHISNEYDGFVNGVINDVLIRVDDGLAYKHPYDEKVSPYYNPPQNLMWGSDASFGPGGFHQSSPSNTQIKSEHAPLYGIHPVSTNTPTPTPSAPALPGQLPLPKLEPEPEPEAVQLETQDEPPELAELNRSGMHKITGKKRRRLLHIIAERNRRLHQNKMYEELYRMVPGLENSSRSTKREVLMRTADWLEDVVEGNRKLKQQLRHSTYTY